MRLDPSIIRHQIDNLLVRCPELAEDDQLRADMIEGETDAHDFLRAIETIRRDACALAGACATTIAEIELRRDRFTRREQAMRDLAFLVMDTANLRKLELPEATYSVRNGTARVIITDDTRLPDGLCRLTRSPDKTKIKEELAAGKTVPGAELSNSPQSLSIRTK